MAGCDGAEETQTRPAFLHPEHHHGDRRVEIIDYSPHGLGLERASGIEPEERVTVELPWGLRLAGAPETPATPTALAVLADVAAPADPRKRLEIADVFAAYAAACKARGRSCQRRCVRCASEGIQRCGRHSHTIERRQTLLVRCEVGGMKKASPLGDCPLRTLISL
jgi:hypothetical protein